MIARDCWAASFWLMESKSTQPTSTSYLGGTWKLPSVASSATSGHGTRHGSSKHCRRRCVSSSFSSSTWLSLSAWLLSSSLSPWSISVIAALATSLSTSGPASPAHPPPASTDASGAAESAEPALFSPLGGCDESIGSTTDAASPNSSVALPGLSQAAGLLDDPVVDSDVFLRLRLCLPTGDDGSLQAGTSTKNHNFCSINCAMRCSRRSASLAGDSNNADHSEGARRRRSFPENNLSHLFCKILNRSWVSPRMEGAMLSTFWSLDFCSNSSEVNNGKPRICLRASVAVRLVLANRALTSAKVRRKILASLKLSISTRCFTEYFAHSLRTCSIKLVGLVSPRHTGSGGCAESTL
mmetsp:Transcript_118164/g.294741  ORF Transcript_118164/g.294741 Transcript_118164/m.294741 type:complete len:354 (-) Transcript_118164:675-1736(-)